MFSYAEMTTRDIGFISQAEQDRLRDATVFVCGTGGMGGACIMALARTRSKATALRRRSGTQFYTL